MAKILKNTTGSNITIADMGSVIIPASSSYTIPPQDYWLWASSNDIITYLNDHPPTPSIIVNDGFRDLSPNEGSAFLQHYFTIQPATSPTIANLSLATANTEVSYTFPSQTRRLQVFNRTKAPLKLSYVSGQSGTLYVSIPAGAVYKEENLSPGSLTAYLQSPYASQTVEILSWI